MTNAPRTERTDVHTLLGRLPLFSELSTEHVTKIAESTREKRLSKGEMLFQKGDTPRGFFIIVFGQVKLAFPSTQGNEKVVEILGPKKSFGEAVMFIDRPYPVFAEALTDTLLLHVGKNAVRSLIESDASFALRMLAGMSMQLHSLIADVESYSLRSSTQRVIGYLIQHCPMGKECNAPMGTLETLEITLSTSKQVIASRLNLTPETLSRILHDLVEAQLIAVQGKKIKIPNLHRLQEFGL
ncbi:MAG: Crp/Fnr family transcriptional regulator [Rhodocyclaceae bacterium]|nr:Crp/Fnr family transcriptional regulator [Rhodocyclaceae bacterium]